VKTACQQACPTHAIVFGSLTHPDSEVTKSRKNPRSYSALPWDAAAVFTYFTISLLFWYLGCVPDLAAARDRAPTRLRARVYAVFALGWRGSAHDWSRYRVAYGRRATRATAARAAPERAR
jgi:hypothetical protein